MASRLNQYLMDLLIAQKDIRTSYLEGGPGVLVSGLIWLMTGLIAYWGNTQVALMVFFFGGMLIFPISVLLVKGLGREGKHQKENPLGTLALESTAILFVGLFVSFLVYTIKPFWFFPFMLLFIGLRYLTFQSLYGMKVYWGLGFAALLLGGACLVFNSPFYLGALLGGILELSTGFLISFKALQRK